MSNILLSSTIGPNKHLIPREVISAIINGTEEVVRWPGLGDFVCGEKGAHAVADRHKA